MDAKLSLTLGIGLGKSCTKAFFTPPTQQDLRANLQTDEQGYEEFSWFSAALSQAQLNGSKAEKTLSVQVSWGGKAPGLGDWRNQAQEVTSKLSKTDADLNCCWIRKVKKIQSVCVCVCVVIDKGLWHLWAKKICRRNSSHSPRNAFEKKMLSYMLLS